MTDPISFTKFRLTLPPPKFRRANPLNASRISENKFTANRIERTQEVEAYLKEVREMRRLKEQFLEAEKAREK